MLAPDRILGGRYRLHRELARGGMAAVWEAEDKVLTRRVAMICVILGFALLIWVRMQTLPHPVLWTAGALLAVGWSAYVYVLIQKNRYIRSHPFDPDA